MGGDSWSGLRFVQISKWGTQTTTISALNLHFWFNKCVNLCCPQHPGGPEVLQENAGKEATKEFDDVGHSKDAIEQMKQYRIGDIVDEEKKSVINDDKEQKKKICIGVCSVLAIGVGVFIIYQGYKLLKSS